MIDHTIPLPLDPNRLQEIKEYNAFFDNIVDMIPSNLYISSINVDSSYFPNNFKFQHKELKGARKKRNKSTKIVQFDTTKADTTIQAKIHIDNTRRDTIDPCKEDDHIVNHHGRDVEIETDENANMGITSIYRGQLAQQDKERLSLNPSYFITTQTHSDIVPKRGQSRIEALREKLHAKVNMKRSQRSGPIVEEQSQTVSKRAARRVEKLRRIQLTEKKAMYGDKLTQADKISSRLGVSESLMMKNMGGMRINITNETPKVGISSDAAKDLVGIDFGGILGFNDIPQYKNNKSITNLGKKKSLEKLLAVAESKKQRLRELKDSEEEERKDKAKQIEWEDTIIAASIGERTKKLDAVQLKKKIKIKKKKKAKSVEAWKSRTENIKGNMDERQKIRIHNIDKRKKKGNVGANLSKKRIKEEEANVKAKKSRLGPFSGSGRAGFEGKKHDFLNKKGLMSKRKESAQ